MNESKLTKEMKRLLTFIFFFSQLHTLSADIHCNATKAHKSRTSIPWCILRNYEVTKPPFLDKPEGDQKMNLHFTFSVREISEIRDSDQVLKIPMYFTVTWEENRLIIDESHRSWEDDSTGPKGENTEEAETLNHLWRPNLEIYGLEDFQKHNILGEMAGLRITKDKRIKYDIKVTIEISCQMDFSEYPFDKHVCTFQVGSYFYDKNSMTCSSKFFDPSAESDFLERNLQHIVKFQKLSSSKKVVRLTSGEYSACGFEVLLQRKHEPLVYQVYIPCILFVTVSWISFIINPEVVPGRMSLLVILFLVIINVFNNVKASAPAAASSRLNAIDRFIVTCIFSIFSAIIEYAIVLSILTLRPNKESERNYNLSDGGNEDIKPKFWYKLLFIIENPRILDASSIIIFSSGFLLFNLHYWFIADYDKK